MLLSVSQSLVPCDCCRLHLVSRRWLSPWGVHARVKQAADTNGQVQPPTQNTCQGNNTSSKGPELPNGTLQAKR